MSQDQFGGRWGIRVGWVATVGCRAALAPAVMLLTGAAMIAMRIMVEPSGAAGMKAQAWFEAARQGDIAALQRAVEQERTPVDVRESGSGLTALMCASGARQPATVEWLLERGADINASTDAYGTALALAVSYGEGTDMAKLLLSRGADPNGCAADRVTPLMQAAQWNNVEGIALLLRAGARPNTRSRYGTTAVSIARAEGNDAIVRMIEQASVK
jgi:hypothetical protein